MATVPTIVDVYPAPSASGIPIGDRITVTFDQEMDTESINTGTFVLVGPNEAPVFGPVDVTPLDQPGFDDEDILSNPYFQGYVKGTISFSRVDASGALVDDSVEDITGDGTLWRTVGIFTPDKPLKQNVDYKFIVLGDENPTDDFDTGVQTRTVFDTVFTGTGTGRLNFLGGYTGTEELTYTIEITTGGQTGTAEYVWWKSSDVLTTYEGVTSTGKRELEDGIYVMCDNDGSFTVGDTFTVVVIPGLGLANTYEWLFSTGSGAIITPPSTSSASGIGDLSTDVLGALQPIFSVSEIVPSDGKYGIAISEDPYVGETITITFSDSPDATTVIADNITVRSEPANGDWDRFETTGDLEYEFSLSSEVLTIQLDPAQLFVNNIVIIELDKSIADVDGNTLETDFESYFTTLYETLYSSVRRIRLDLGELISDVPEETIYLAILEASINADMNAFTSSISNASYYNHARREYTTCLAELTLTRGLLGNGGLTERMSKSLGDLSVSRGGNLSALRDLLGGLEDCIVRWELPVQTGGNTTTGTSLRPISSVKGGWADDSIVVGRQWENTTGVGIESAFPAGNSKRYKSPRRDFKTFRRRGSSRYGRDDS